MGIIFNRGSSNDGCSGHHYGDYELKSASICEATPFTPKPHLEITRVKKCQHRGCYKTGELTVKKVTGFDSEEELREALKEKIDELKQEVQKL